MAVLKASTEETGVSTYRGRLVKRNKRKLQASSVNLTCDFACGHFVVCTIDSVEDETPSITRQKEEAERDDCYWCRMVKLGGREFAGEEPKRWKIRGRDVWYHAG